MHGILKHVGLETYLEPFLFFQTLFHTVHLRESEMEIYRDRGISITHCPISNLK